jgi:hypothetical protein
MAEARPRTSRSSTSKAAQAGLDLGVNIGDRNNMEIALDIAKLCENEFGKQHGELVFAKLAPLKRQSSGGSWRLPARHRPRGRRSDAPHPYGC